MNEPQPPSDKVPVHPAIRLAGYVFLAQCNGITAWLLTVGETPLTQVTWQQWTGLVIGSICITGILAFLNYTSGAWARDMPKVQKAKADEEAKDQENGVEEISETSDAQ